MKNNLTLLFAFLFSNLFSQDFNLNIGNNKENRSNKIEFYKDAYYVIGSVENKFGTISKLDLNGREQWTYKNSLEGTFNDFHIVNDRILVIGSVGVNTASKSYLVILNPSDGATISSKIYDFSPNLRESLVRITSYTDPSGNLNIVASGIEVYVTSGLLYDRAILYNLDNDGNLVKRTILKEDNDNEYVFPSFNPKNGDILWYGNQLEGGPNGVILKTDKAGNKIDGKVFTSSHYHSCHSSNYDGNIPIHIMGGRLIGSNRAIISKYEDTKLIYTYEFSGLSIFQSISKLSQPNTYRIIGTLNGTTIDPYIIDFVDEGSTLKVLQSYSLKEIHNGIISFFTTKLANGKNALCLSRPTSDGFGLSDGVISIFDGDALPKCYTAFPKVFNPTKINLQSTEFFINTRTENLTTSINSVLNSEDYNSKLDCTCAGGASSITNLDYSACKGNNVTVNGQIYNASGTYIQTLETSAGCDSILNINVVITGPKEGKIQASICQGQSYELNGQTYNIAGSYFQNLKTTTGCDSIINIKINNSNINEYQIQQPDPAVFCETSEKINIVGNIVNGDNINYLWQINKDKTNFKDASGINNSQNYLTDKLQIGSYEFRRISIHMAIGSCIDTSKTVVINVVDKTKLGLVLYKFNNPNCIGDSVNIHLTNPIFKAKYIWSSTNGLTIITKVDSTSVFIKGNASGSHKIFVTLNAKGCENAIPTEENIIIRPGPFIDLGLDTTICSLDGDFELKAEGFESVTWNDGSDVETFSVKEKGIYSVTVVDTFGCRSRDEIRIKQFCCNFFAPNIILQGSGGQNEEFFIEDKGCVIKSIIRIYDRWGNLIYRSEEGKKPWDGLYNGAHVEQGVYTYIYEYTALDEDELEFEGKLSGDLTVIRKK